ncbi:MAG TPA: four-helix bundle copper-binding protein [Tepidisphaeraceae bacterium]|jgi:hypothetical protein|nr:four-helix bundle copper-binding protein [Tepidisphaeraceae bacterium]
MAVAQPNDYSEQTLVCIQNCQDCHRACLQTLAYCLRQGGRHAEGDHLRLLMDCADICLTSAAFMIRGSDLHAHTCAACAEVCRRCAEEYDHMSDDLRMKALADTCRHCAESCRSMAAGHAGGTGDGVAKVGRGATRAIRQAGATAAPVMTRRKTK